MSRLPHRTRGVLQEESMSDERDFRDLLLIAVSAGWIAGRDGYGLQTQEAAKAAALQIHRLVKEVCDERYRRDVEGKR